MSFFVTLTGKRYHQRQGCYGADIRKDPDELGSRQPCPACFPGARPAAARQSRLSTAACAPIPVH